MQLANVEMHCCVTTHDCIEWMPELELCCLHLLLCMKRTRIMSSAMKAECVDRRGRSRRRRTRVLVMSESFATAGSTGTAEVPRSTNSGRCGRSYTGCRTGACWKVIWIIAQDQAEQEPGRSTPPRAGSRRVAAISIGDFPKATDRPVELVGQHEALRFGRRVRLVCRDLEVLRRPIRLSEFVLEPLLEDLRRLAVLLHRRSCR